MMLSKVLGATGRLLIVAGVVILGFVAYQLWGTSLEESRQQGDLLSEYATSVGADPEAELADVLAAPSDAEPTDEQGPAPTPSAGEPAGIIEIPRLDLTRMMVEGTSRSDLKKGPGHYVGTPFPGQSGNVGIAGHRTTYGAPFNRIDELQPGDEIVLSTSQGSFTYKVIPAPGSTNQAWYTVSPSQVEVLEDMGDSRVTLTACHPKYSAKQRIIVHAVLVGPTASPSPQPEDLGDPELVQASVAQDFDEGLGSTPEELPISLAYGGVAALTALGAWLVARNVKQWWAIWLVATPILLVLLWNGYVHMDRYLPAI